MAPEIDGVDDAEDMLSARDALTMLGKLPVQKKTRVPVQKRTRLPVQKRTSIQIACAAIEVYFYFVTSIYCIYCKCVIFSINVVRWKLIFQ